MKILPLPDLAVLQKVLSYDPETGAFTWLRNRGNTAVIGSPAGCVSTSGYVAICINMKRYLAHRIAYKMYYGVDPDGLVDHVDGDKANNRISNLRVATGVQNQGNSRNPSSNKSGIKGVCWNKKMKRWVAQIGDNKRRVYLGSFLTKEEAAQAYADAARMKFGNFAKQEGWEGL